MKNIHILPTNKLTRLVTSDSELILAGYPETTFKTGKNIYITSDEEIKEGDYVIWNNKVYKDSKRSFTGVDYSQCKKIILTTDQDLIEDGIQAIDDEFLEWFVDKSNDSGKPIDIVETKHIIKDYVDDQDAYGYDVSYYKIIIPS